MRTYCNKQRTIEVCRGAHAHAGALIPPHERLIQIRRGWLKIKRNVKKKKNYNLFCIFDWQYYPQDSARFTQSCLPWPPDVEA